jgi:hypothetical protein
MDGYRGGAALSARSVLTVHTMPGAVFLKNDGFVDHARSIGLAAAPQQGIAY